MLINSDIFNILVGIISSHALSSVYVLCVGDEDLQVSYFGSTRGHRERWLYIFFSSMKTKLKLSNAAFTIGFLNISG